MTVPQTSVQRLQGFGIPGELFNNSPVRADPYVLNSTDPLQNVFGRAFTVQSQGVAQAGNPEGTAVYAGILVNPKAVALYGTAGGGPLAPTLQIPNGFNVEIASMGDIIVVLPAAAAIGDIVIFDNTTGALSTIAPGANLPTGKTPANAYVNHYTVTAAGLAVITLTKLSTTPVPAGVAEMKTVGDE